ncbi:transmembrane emp24 domain-containing protein 7-like [Actinia tenebrosa]|uniref:Transmembrane emp24 domain-containing protein 7-like n=1 Tax=Actinia tenebrosa TaxID=6105 RepID=A0A6P8IZZ2_ACTTE|nr:transmembrane emp24 domain-containing protein 7-like [Actinia tenebrosa]
MTSYCQCLVYLVFLALSCVLVRCTELTLELEDNARQCFYEDVKKGTKITLEFQVITGGNYDVDVTLYDPKDKALYTVQKKQYDSHTVNADEDGTYKFCFSNEFSTFTHKTVYFDFQAGEDQPMTRSMGEHHTALTQMETACVTIHENLKIAIDYQTHHRLRETQGRDLSENLNERVQWWSIGESVLIICVGILQVFLLRNFFAERRSNI